MHETFSGYIEVTCPCCDNYRHYKKEEIPSLAERTYKGDGVVCDECWEVVTYFIKKFGCSERSLTMAQGDFTAEEAKATEEAVIEMHKALSRPKQADYLGHLNDILLFLARCQKELSKPAS